MSLTKSSFIGSYILSIFIALSFCKLTFAVTEFPGNFTFNRDYVSIWFYSPLSPSHRHQKPNLEVMVKLISGTFGTIAIDNAPILPRLLPVEELVNNRAIIPSVVAEHNNRSGYEHQLKVISSFDLSPSSGIKEKPTFKNSFLVAKRYADEANKIFPGTVETLLFHHDHYLRVNSKRVGHEDIPTLLHSAWEVLNQTRNDMNSSQYNLGVSISLDLCGNSVDGEQKNSSFSMLSKFVEYADIIFPVIYIPPFKSQHQFQPGEEHEMQVSLFENCQNNVKKLNPEVRTIPIVICNSPQNIQREGISKYFQCWQLMNNFAVKNKQQVIMYEAFDRYEPEYLMGAGWWRLKNEAAQTVTEASFVVKAQDEIYSNNTIPDGLTAVVFNHRVRFVPRLTSYSEPEVNEMLELVSTRFSTIVTGHKPFLIETTIPQPNTVTKTFIWIPEIVADFNKNHISTPLTVISTFYQASNATWNSDSNSQDGLINLEVATEVAQRANSIYPGTVESLVYHKISGYTTPGFTSKLRELRTTLSSGLGRRVIENGMRLGVVIDMETCRFHMASVFQSISEWINLFVIDMSDVSSASSGSGVSHRYPDSYVGSKLAAASGCRMMYKQMYPEADVKVSINCSEIVRNNETMVEDMALCIRMVMVWGLENEVQVIFSQAFDLPHGFMGGNVLADPNGGWWKLRRRSEVNITKESFEEKLQITWNDNGTTDPDQYFSSRYSWQKLEDKGGNREESGSNAGYVVTIVILSLLCVCLTVLVVYLHDPERFRGLLQRIRQDDSELQLL
ncbi:unnamed protein product [Orchesella dallaii]|uniref:Uncharacterized protein n=1 Tax=Orchesella dallaii TaxID=48710 RepID=A0ABP1S9Z2_9HEXA